MQTIKIITLGVMLSAGLTFAWTAPTISPVTPPTNNTTPPLDKTSNFNNKTGSFGTGPYLVNGMTNFHGNVSVLGAAPAPACTGSGCQAAFGIFHEVFASLKKPFKPFKNVFASLFNVNTAYADISVDPNQPPPGPSMPYISFSDNYGIFNPPLNSDMETSDSTPTFSFVSDTDGTYSFNSGPCVSSSTDMNVSVALDTNGDGKRDTPAKTVTLNTLYDDAYGCSLILTAADGRVSNQLDFGFYIVGNPPPPPPLPVAPLNNDLYVSGSLGIGTNVPSEKLEVVGDVKVASLENTAPKLVKICADIEGNIILCPSGSATMGLNQTSWTVPDGVFRLHVVVVGGGGGGGGVYNTFAWPSGSDAESGGGGAGGISVGDINVIPGQVFSVNVGKRGLAGSLGQWYGVSGHAGGDGGNSNFGAYFSATGGDSGQASHQAFGDVVPGTGGSGGTGITANGNSGHAGDYSGWSCYSPPAGGTLGISSYNIYGGGGGNGESICEPTYGVPSNAEHGVDGAVVVYWSNLLN